MQYKKYRDLLSTLLKDCKNKNKYFSYFNENIKDVKKTWTGIKSIIYEKYLNSDFPSSIFNNWKYIAESTTKANETLCTIWYHLYNLKNMKNTHGGKSKAAAATSLKGILLRGCFSRFLNCSNDSKSRKASQMYLKIFSTLLHQQFNWKLTFFINHLKNIFFQRLSSTLSLCNSNS